MRRREATSSLAGRRRAVIAAAVVALASTAGWGVAAESKPEAVTMSPVATATPGRPQSTDVVQVYLVRDEHLVPVPRAGRSAADAVAALAAGPTETDVEVKLRSPLPALPVTLGPYEEPNVVTIDVPAEFAALPQADRFLAAAQLVWTATDACCATQVRMLLDDRPLSVPTDGGPTTRPLRRDDYGSVAPLGRGRPDR